MEWLSRALLTLGMIMFAVLSSFAQTIDGPNSAGTEIQLVADTSRQFAELRIEVDFSGLENTIGRDLTETEKAEILASARQILLARASVLSSGGTPSLTAISSDEFLLTVPGADSEQVRVIVETRGDFSLHLVDKNGVEAVKSYMATGATIINQTGVVVDTNDIPSFPKGSLIFGVYDMNDQGPDTLKGVTVATEPRIIDEASVESVSIGRNSVSGKSVVNIWLSRQARDAFLVFNRTHIGALIVLLLDDEALATAEISEPVRGDRVAIGNFGNRQSLILAAILGSKPLPVSLKVISKAP